MTVRLRGDNGDNAEHIEFSVVCEQAVSAGLVVGEAFSHTMHTYVQREVALSDYTVRWRPLGNVFVEAWRNASKRAVQKTRSSHTVQSQRSDALVETGIVYACTGSQLKWTMSFHVGHEIGPKRERGRRDLNSRAPERHFAW